MSQPASFSPEWFALAEVKQLVKAFAGKQNALRFVGGAVRDSLLGHDVHDIDAATTCLPEETIAVLEAAGIKAIPTGLDHGTITAVINGRQFEITTLRSDIDCDGRHAQVVYTDNWQQDAARRDFTINALYLSPEGELFDFFGGEADLKLGHVRFIGDPAQRIREDRLRILRFFRFHARFGRGSIDSAALGACKTAAHEIEQLSGERIQKELLSLLALKNSGPTFALMETQNILEYALGFATTTAPYLSRYEQIEALSKHTVDAHLKLLMFLHGQKNAHDVLAALATRLRLSNNMLRQLETLQRHYGEFAATISAARQKQLIRKLGAELFIAAVILSWAMEMDEVHTGHSYHAMIRLADSWQSPVFPVTGDDLIKAGMKPGKELGAALARLEDAWEASDYQLDRQALLARL